MDDLSDCPHLRCVDLSGLQASTCPRTGLDRFGQVSGQENLSAPDRSSAAVPDRFPDGFIGQSSGSGGRISIVGCHHTRRHSPVEWPATATPPSEPWKVHRNFGR